MNREGVSVLLISQLILELTEDRGDDFYCNQGTVGEINACGTD